MYTRCTHCDTVFRVTPQQLQVSSGKVRCGRCNQVFDAFSSLSAQLPLQQDAPAAARTPRAEEGPAAAWRAVEDVRPLEHEAQAEAAPRVQEDEQGGAAPGTSVPSARAEEPAAPAPPRVPLPAPVAAGPDVAPAAGAAAADAPRVPRSSPAAAEDVLTLPDELFTKAAPARAHWAWGAGSAALGALALAQAAWIFATPLAGEVPALRPVLEGFCAGTGCTVALPKLPDQLFIEASDLQLLDAARPSEVLLTVTIRNRAAVAQAYPLLELTLTGVANQVTSRKVFQPLEYAEAGTDVGRGIGANQEVAVRLYLSTGNLRPAGYRVYLYFA
jgi:predicted Zn finger-like uncharacterized protein